MPSGMAWRCGGDFSGRGTPALPLVAALAALSTTGMLALAGCEAPAPSSPTLIPTTCFGVVTSSGPCDEPSSTTNIVLPQLACPARSDVQQVQRDIPLTIEQDASAGTLVCQEQNGSADLTLYQARIYQALLFLRRLRFDAPLPWTTKPVYDWLRVTIPKGIILTATGLSSSCLNCRGPIRVVTSPTNAPPDMSLGNTPFEVIVHEARHADGWRHTCARAGRPAESNDRTIAEMGAYGVQYWLYVWIADHSNEDAALKTYSRRRASRMRQNSFCCECTGPNAREDAPTLSLLILPPPSAVDMQDRLGSRATGKIADVIAVPGYPLRDVAALQHAKFVMKDGVIVKNEK